MVIQNFGEFSLKLYIATCTNSLCGNYEFESEVWGDPDEPDINCGACGLKNISWREAE